tara:strand:+ start:202 stop:543 length:342 start_codon:yes stop_codon:yes gene_type:complete
MATCDINLNVKNIKFCPGPCNCKKVEPEHTILNNKEWYVFKPHSGGCYTEISYAIGNYSLNLLNVRLCRGCNSRNLEFWAEECHESLNQDAETILKKLNIDISTIQSPEVIDV